MCGKIRFDWNSVLADTCYFFNDGTTDIFTPTLFKTNPNSSIKIFQEFSVVRDYLQCEKTIIVRFLCRSNLTYTIDYLFILFFSKK